MEHRPLGNSGLRASVVGLGTWVLGGGSVWGQGLERVFAKDELRSNGAWNPSYLTANRRRVLDLLDAWRGLTRRYQCTLAQLVIAWTATQPGVTHVICGARHVEQAKENAAAGNLQLAPEGIQQMRRDVDALGEPIREEEGVTV